MNAQTAKQEGLSVVNGGFERQELTGAAFPQYNGIVSGDARLDGRLWYIEVRRLKNGKLSMDMHHGPEKIQAAHIAENDGHAVNDKAPRWKGTVEVMDREYQVSVWLSFTKKDTRYLSFRFQEIVDVDDSLMDVFDDAPSKDKSFLDDVNSDSREAVRDPDEELEADLLSGPERVLE